MTIAFGGNTLVLDNPAEYEYEAEERGMDLDTFFAQSMELLPPQESVDRQPLRMKLYRLSENEQAKGIIRALAQRQFDQTDQIEIPQSIRPWYDYQLLLDPNLSERIADVSLVDFIKASPSTAESASAYSADVVYVPSGFVFECNALESVGDRTSFRVDLVRMSADPEQRKRYRRTARSNTIAPDDEANQYFSESLNQERVTLTLNAKLASGEYAYGYTRDTDGRWLVMEISKE